MGQDLQSEKKENTPAFRSDPGLSIQQIKNTFIRLHTCVG